MGFVSCLGARSRGDTRQQGIDVDRPAAKAGREWLKLAFYESQRGPEESSGPRRYHRRAELISQLAAERVAEPPARCWTVVTTWSRLSGLLSSSISPTCEGC